MICLLGIALACHRPETIENRMWRANNIVQNFHVPMDEAMKIAEKDTGSNSDKPPAAIALFGLVPMAVGFAYLLFYYGDPARKAVHETEGTPLVPRN